MARPGDLGVWRSLFGERVQLRNVQHSGMNDTLGLPILILRVDFSQTFSQQASTCAYMGLGQN